jgi:hypothetical protein
LNLLPEDDERKRRLEEEPEGAPQRSRVIRQLIKRQITAATFRRKMQRLREQYPSFVRE